MPDLTQLLQELTARTQGNYQAQKPDLGTSIGGALMGLSQVVQQANQQQMEREKAQQEAELHRQQAGYYKAHAEEMGRQKQPPTPDEENLLNQLYQAANPTKPGDLPPPVFKFPSRESANEFYNILKTKLTNQSRETVAGLKLEDQKARDTMSPEVIDFLSKISGEDPAKLGEMTQKEFRLAMNAKRNYEGIPNPGRDRQRNKENADKAEQQIAKVFALSKFPSTQLEDFQSSFEDVMSRLGDESEMNKIDLSKLKGQDLLIAKMAINRYKRKLPLLKLGQADMPTTGKSLYEGLK